MVSRSGTASASVASRLSHSRVSLSPWTTVGAAPGRVLPGRPAAHDDDVEFVGTAPVSHPRRLNLDPPTRVRRWAGRATERPMTARERLKALCSARPAPEGAAGPPPARRD